MLKYAVSFSVIAALTSLAQAGVPGDIILEQTFYCEQQVGDANVVLSGTLSKAPDDLSLPVHTQDHIADVVGNVTLSVSDAKNVFAPFGGPSFFLTTPVQGALLGGMPTFPMGTGYKLSKPEGSLPLMPAFESLTVSDENGVKKATFVLEGQDHVTTVECQLVNVEL
jgi:hypothetical protein